MMKVHIVLLGFLSVVLAVASAFPWLTPAYFPRGKLVTYKYTVDAKAGIIQPAPHASEFFIDSILTAQSYNNDLTLKNAYYIRLHNVTHKLYNGNAVHSADPPSIPEPVPEVAKVIETPFVIVFDRYGRLHGIKWMGNESKWSKNIKRSIASMLQLDMVNIFPYKLTLSHSFITPENTIHGSCQVAYTVQRKDPVLSNNFVITKFHEPKNCSHFSYQTFNHIEPEKCYVSKEDDMTTATKRVVELTYEHDNILITKLNGHSVINYFPWQANAEAHYILTNQTLILSSVSENPEKVPLSTGDIDCDITFTKPNTKYAITGDLDVTQGRHPVDQGKLTGKLMKILDEAASYLKENHMGMKPPEWKHGQALNRIQHIMGFMNVESLRKVYLYIGNKQTVKNIFLEMVPTVGTTAGCLFTRNVIRDSGVSNATAISMLSKLPMHVKVPSVKLLKDMEELLTWPDTVVSIEVRKTSILCFATLIHKTFANGTTDPSLRQYLEYLESRLKSETSYEMKLVYLMAIKNVAVPDILNILEPIIRGEELISKDPLTIRVYAIWAIKKVVTELRDYTYDLLWPILQDSNLSQTLRIAAYDVLINTKPDTERLMNMYWFMVYEKNEHLYNYHVETLKGLAESADPCLAPLQKVASKILRFTRIRQTTGPLSTMLHIDSFDQDFGYGEAVKISVLMNQQTGLPYVGSFNHFTSVARKTASRWGVHWHIEGLADLVKNLNKEVSGHVETPVTDENVKRVLTKAARNMNPIKSLQICLVLTWNDNVVDVLHYDRNPWMELFKDLKAWKDTIARYNQQDIFYDDHYEMHIPTDFGVPAILATRTPKLDSKEESNMTLQVGDAANHELKIKYQQWKHGEYAMSVYNPIADTWHSIRRTGTYDVVVGIDANVVYDKEKKSLKVKLARLPITEYSTIGLLTHAKNFVTVTDDDSGALTTSCPTCLHTQNVTGVISNRTYELSVDSKDTALRFSRAIYNCEGHVNPLPMADWYKAISMDYNEPIGYKDWVRLAMRLRQKIKNDMISSQRASCSNLMKLEPSIVHAASQVEFWVKLDIESIIVYPLRTLTPMKYSVHGRLDVTSNSTKQSMRQWDTTVNVNLSPGHVTNDMKITLNRITPEEKNLQISMEGKVEYPQFNSDILNYTNTLMETKKELNITMGRDVGTISGDDDMEVIFNVLGALSDEQISHAYEKELYEACQLQKENPLLQTPHLHVSKTWPCVYEAILHTTLRNYTVNVQLKKLPRYVETAGLVFQDMVLSQLFPHMSYTLNQTDQEKLQILVQFLVGTYNAKATILQPFRSYELLQLPFGNKIWNNLMDNVHFSNALLTDILDGSKKICTIYPLTIVTYDWTTIPHELGQKWTLLTGDVGLTQSFSVFVARKHEKRLAVLIYFGNDNIEIIPNDTIPATTNVKVNGKNIANPENGVLVPENDINSFNVRLTVEYAHLNIDSTQVPVQVYYTGYSVTVMASSRYRGDLSGLCGFMNETVPDSTHPIPLYTLAEH